MLSVLLQRSPHREGLDRLVVRLRLRHALVDPLVRDGVVLLLLGALALDALAAHGGVERERRKNQRHGGGEDAARNIDVWTGRSAKVCALVQTRSAVWTSGVVSTFFFDEAAAPISGFARPRACF